MHIAMILINSLMAVKTSHFAGEDVNMCRSEIFVCSLGFYKCLLYPRKFWEFILSWKKNLTINFFLICCMCIFVFWFITNRMWSAKLMIIIGSERLLCVFFFLSVFLIECGVQNLWSLWFVGCLFESSAYLFYDKSFLVN